MQLMQMNVVAPEQTVRLSLFTKRLSIIESCPSQILVTINHLGRDCEWRHAVCITVHWSRPDLHHGPFPWLWSGACSWSSQGELDLYQVAVSYCSSERTKSRPASSRSGCHTSIIKTTRATLALFQTSCYNHANVCVQAATTTQPSAQ